MIAARRLKSSAQLDSVTSIVFKISRPAKMACVRDGEISRAAIGMPVLWRVFRAEAGLWTAVLATFTGPS